VSPTGDPRYAGVHGVSLTLGVVSGIVLASQVVVGLGMRGSRAATGSPGAPVRDVDYRVVRDAVRKRVRAVDARLQAWIRRTIRRAGDDPDTSAFDPNVYSFSEDTLGRALRVPVLGHGYSRVVVRIAPGVVAKFPWREEGITRSEAELGAWDREGEDVRALLLPPLDYVSPPGVSIFPEARPLQVRMDAQSEDWLAFTEAKRRWVDLFNARWDDIVEDRTDADKLTSDIEARNWGWYDGRVVLVDYEPEGSGGFNRAAGSAQRTLTRQALRATASRDDRVPFASWLRDVARGLGYRSTEALGRAHPSTSFHDRWFYGYSPAAIIDELRSPP